MKKKPRILPKLLAIGEAGASSNVEGSVDVRDSRFLRSRGLE
jgi:hypothetical protein